MSLHSHSSCSRETLTFIPQLAARIPLVATLFERSASRYAREYGRPLDFGSYYWRPPLSAAAVIASERENIERRLRCPAVVSLTDHDTLEGPRALRAAGNGEVPLSVEWSIPFHGTVFHLGVHAISPARVEEAERVLAAYTTGTRDNLGEILDWLCESPETFIVLNHPYWDLPRIGSLRHDSALLALIRTHRHRIHALELNGYRAWSENRRVLPLAEGFGFPVVGGGDRHGRAPNAIVNLTGATCFAEFAADLRASRSTYCVVLPEYVDPCVARVLQGARDCLSRDPKAPEGGGTWCDRVFVTLDGVETPLASLWEGAPWWLAGSLAVTRMLGSGPSQSVFRLLTRRAHEELESDVCPHEVLDVGDSLSGVTP